MQNETQLPTTPATRWLENIALEEISMEESGYVNFNEHLDPQVLIEESSIRLMNQLRDFFETYVGRFNEYRGGVNSGAQVKIFKISNTVNDFMLFRNSLRLIVSRKSHDVISVGFMGKGNNIFAARKTNFESPQSHFDELTAVLGPFNKISWRFQGEDVDLEALVRHYLSEFLRHSAK